MIAIDRAFVRIGSGLVHYRHAGDVAAQPPVVLLHGGPGSSASLLPMIVALAADRRVIAPDTPGCGDSDPLAREETAIADYAEALGLLLDRLDAPLVDLYGHHTGAQIACEFAIRSPDRVRRMVLDGAALFPAALRREFLDRYAPAITPTESGDHLAWAWQFARNLTCYFPHYARDEAHRTGGTLLSANVATGTVAEMLKVWPTWHRAYRAAFAHDLAPRLPLVAAETLVLRIAGDPLADHAQAAANLLERGAVSETTRDARADVVAAFLA